MNRPQIPCSNTKSLLHVIKSPGRRKNRARKKSDGQNFPKFGDWQNLTDSEKTTPRQNSKLLETKINNLESSLRKTTYCNLNYPWLLRNWGQKIVEQHFQNTKRKWRSELLTPNCIHWKRRQRCKEEWSDQYIQWKYPLRMRNYFC